MLCLCATGLGADEAMNCENIMTADFNTYKGCDVDLTNGEGKEKLSYKGQTVTIENCHYRWSSPKFLNVHR